MPAIPDRPALSAQFFMEALRNRVPALVRLLQRVHDSIVFDAGIKKVCRQNVPATRSGPDAGASQGSVPELPGGQREQSDPQQEPGRRLGDDRNVEKVVEREGVGGHALIEGGLVGLQVAGLQRRIVNSWRISATGPASPPAHPGRACVRSSPSPVGSTPAIAAQLEEGLSAP